MAEEGPQQKNTDFIVINNIPDKAMKRLPTKIKQELWIVNEKLSEDPFDAKNLRAKEMFGPLRGVYEVYLGKKGYRLIFTVELNTKKVFLKYAGERTHAIRKKWG